jgi:uncharacterized caspase-like protein
MIRALIRYAAIGTLGVWWTSVSVAQTRETPPQSAHTGRQALIIGNAAYSDAPLANTLHDADDMKAALEHVGFGVAAAKNLTQSQMRDEIRKFANRVRAGDVALFYFSGHGMQIDGENFLAPVDVSTSSEMDAKKTCVRFDEVQKWFEESPARLTILVMDACRSNPFQRRTRDLLRGMAPVDAGLGSYVVFSASPGHIADDNPRERNGLFTKFLLETLRQPPALSQIFRTVRDAVYLASNHGQLPDVHDHVLGDFYFVPPVEGMPEPTPNKRSSAESLEQGKVLFHQGKCQAALELFDKAVRADPENAYAQNSAGLAAACMNLRAQAAERFNMAIELNPALTSAYLNRGGLYLASGRYDLAVEDFAWAIDQEPENAILYARRGRAYFGLRRYEEALADFNRAIEFNPTDAQAFHGRGQVYQRQGKYREALADYEAAVARKSDFAAAVQDRKAVLQRLGR